MLLISRQCVGPREFERCSLCGLVVAMVVHDVLVSLKFELLENALSACCAVFVVLHCLLSYNACL